MAKNSSASNTGYSGSLFGEIDRLQIVHAKFVEATEQNLADLLMGYSQIRILTYSSSLSLVNYVAELIDEMEIIFGREDIVNQMAQYIAYQEEIIQDLRKEFKGKDYIRGKLDQGLIKLYIVQGLISHEKLFLLNGEAGTRVISGSANFSERAFSGNQNESFICFDNDPAAWQYFSQKYEQIRERSSMSISKRAVLDDAFDLEQLPVFDLTSTDHKATPQFIIIEERSPQKTIINKLFTPRIPKQYEGLSQVITVNKGMARLDRQTRVRAVQYVKSNSRSSDENPEEYLMIDSASGIVLLSGKDLDLNPDTKDIKNDVDLMLEYFEGYKQFRGATHKLAHDYFTFMSWLYISPFICDFRNYAEATLDDDSDKLDYPIFGLLYGKSNCGKSELIKWLLLSMFQREGFLPNDWFTKGRVVGLREENRRYPMAFDDMDKTRFGNHAIPLIKEDYIGMREYPAVVLSMNADKDTFESEVRKRCLIIYTGASLPDHTGESRDLASKLKRMKRNIGDSLYREYLRRVMERLENKPPKDVLAFSSGILREIFAEYASTELPAWCELTTMDRYIQTKHDKVKDELRSYIRHSPDAWSENAGNLVLRLTDIHQIRKLQKDVPDYLIHSVSGNALIFLREELELFLEEPVFSKTRRSFLDLFRPKKKSKSL